MATSMTEEDGDGPRLVVWAPCLTPSTSHLPTLDPDSLYAATLLQARRVYKRYSLSAPSSLLHSRIPCLETARTGLSLASDVDAIQRHSRRLVEQGQKVGSGERSSSLLEEDRDTVEASADQHHGVSRTSRHRWARIRALERLLLSTLHPLVYQEMFSSSQSLFSRHTAKVYQSGLPFLYRNSLVSRLRKELRVHFSTRATFMESSGLGEQELGAILAESNSRAYLQQEEERQRQRLADRSGISKDGKRGIAGLSAFRGNGMLSEEKEQAARAFSEMRLESYAKKVLDAFAAALGSHQYLFASDRPSLLDLRLFSLLAPLLLPVESFPALAKSVLPSLLRSDYTALVKHTERLQALIWPIEVHTVLESGLTAGQDVTRRQVCLIPDWPSLSGRQDVSSEDSSSMPMTIRIASSLGTVCGQMYHYSSSIFSARERSLKPGLSEATDAGKGKEKEEDSSKKAKTSQMTEAERHDARRVTIGRWIWISSAVIGLIGTAFASGLVAIELIDPADGGQDDEEEEEKAKMEVVEDTPIPSQHGIPETEEEDVQEGEEDDDLETEYDEDEIQEEAGDDSEEFELVYLSGDEEVEVDGDDGNLAEEVDVDDDD